MTPIFQKTSFPKAIGGTRYKWNEAKQNIPIPKDGKYVVAITASCGNKNDDDLRAVINHYAMGKYELHQEKISWKGFNTSAAWDGNSLKGGEKTVYIFVELQKEQDLLIEFVADGKPILKKIEVFQLNEGETSTLKNLTPKTPIQTNTKGIPLVSFVTLGTKFKKFSFTTTCRSGSQKNGTDGDNVKVVKNGKILQNKEAPTSRKYKNYLICGDQTQGKETTIDIPLGDFDLIENAIELWTDETPVIKTLEIELYGRNEISIKVPGGSLDKRLEFLVLMKALEAGFRTIGWKYSADFINNAAKKNPKEVFFGEKSDLSQLIKKRQEFDEIKGLILQEIKAGNLEGDINLGKPFPEVKFKGGDLEFAIQGLKRIHYTTKQKNDTRFYIQIVLFDLYDFSQRSFQKSWNPLKHFKTLLVNAMDIGESIRAVNNFEIEIHMSTFIEISNE
jgi:hypothetical protein